MDPQYRLQLESAFEAAESGKSQILSFFLLALALQRKWE